jgi:chromate reductase, NAD(P)H dehydrogenase (quinone)
MKRVIGIVGSLRKASYNQALFNAFVQNAPEELELIQANIDGLPFYNEDFEAPYPEAASELKAFLATADAFLIVTPEYNRGVPGILKNAIDWMSRPAGSSPFSKKPILVAGASDGNIGTAVAQASLKHTLLHLNAHVLGRPEFYVSRAQDKFDAEGKLLDLKTKEAIVSAWGTLSEVL